MQKDGREFEEFFRIPMLLEKAIKHLRIELRTMAQAEQLVNIVRSLLHPENHLTLRKAGIKILLLWLRDPKSVTGELLQLYASVVPLCIFANDDPNVEIDQPDFPLVYEGEPPMVTSVMGTREQALAMFGEILEFMTFDEDADRESTTHLYHLLRKHYLAKLYPVTCYRVGIIAEPVCRHFADGIGEEEGDHYHEQQQQQQQQQQHESAFDEHFSEAAIKYPFTGFVEACPEQLQALLMRYFAMWTIQSPELFVVSSSLGSPNTLPVATFILQEIILGTFEDRELVHEVISQSLQLPAIYKSIVKIALSVLRTWVFCSKERRPSFLLSESLDAAGDDENVKNKQPGTFEGFLCKYMGLVGQLLHNKRSTGMFNEQFDLLREGIYFLRGVSMKAFFDLGQSSWSCLLSLLLSLCEHHLTSKIATISDAGKAEEFAALLVETLFGVWIRSETMDRQQWEHLAKVLSACTQWRSVVVEWSKVVLELTELMAQTVFQMDPAIIVATEYARKKSLRAGTFESGQLQTLLALPTPLGRAMASAMELMNQKTFAQDLASAKNDNFLMWVELGWVKENAVFLWKNMLRALGDINAISAPETHEVAMQCLASVTERLFALREAQPYCWRPLPPLYECALILLDACDLPARAYEKSRCIAYAIACKLFVRRHDQSFPDEYWSRFYLAIVNGLSDKDDPVAAVILLSASHLFGRALPGAAILMPAFLKCIAAMLNAVIPFERTGLMVPMMRIASHVAVYPDVMPNLTIPRIEAPLPIMSAIPITCAGEMELSTIRLQTRDFLALLDGQDGVKDDALVHSILLNVASVLLMNELLAVKNPSETLIDGYLNVLLDHLLPKDSPVLPVIFDQFFALAQGAPLYGDRFGLDRQTMVIQRLLTSIGSVFADTEMAMKEQDELVSRLTLMLLEWVMALPADWLAKQHSLREQLFSALEESLKRASSVFYMKKTKSQGSLYQGEYQPHLAKEAAEVTLVHLMHHLKNFSPINGPDTMSSQIPDLTDSNFDRKDRTLYFALDESAILSVQHLANQAEIGGPQVRITVRNAAGRFTWDSRLFFETFQHRLAEESGDWGSIGVKGELDWNGQIIEERVEPYCKKNGDYFFKRDFKRMPRTSSAVDLEHTDMLCELLAYISEEHPECITGERSCLIEAEPVPMSRIEAVKQVKMYCQDQIQIEEKVANVYKEAGNKTAHYRVEPPKAKKGANLLIPYHFCRQFLAAFGFFDPTTITNGQLFVLTKTPAVVRDLQGFDKLPAREVIKIGVLFVGSGQEDEASILKNDHSIVSPGYEEFVKSLGWTVDLKNHHGYTGGLEAGMTINDEAIYHATSTVESIFHDATHIIQVEHDSKMISIKRHIGNDHVLLVWNEHYRDYRPTIMRTDFANVQIVVTPIEGHLYRVSVYREQGVGPFGPLFDGAIITRALLGPLCRTTAINAHRAVLATLGRNLAHPMSIRARDLAVIVERHAQKKWSMEQFLEYTLFANGVQEEMAIQTGMTAGSSAVSELNEQVEALQIE